MLWYFCGDVNTVAHVRRCVSHQATTWWRTSQLWRQTTPTTLWSSNTRTLTESTRRWRSTVRRKSSCHTRIVGIKFKDVILQVCVCVCVPAGRSTTVGSNIINKFRAFALSQGFPRDSILTPPPAGEKRNCARRKQRRSNLSQVS